MNAEEYLRLLKEEFPYLKEKLIELESEMIFFNMEIFAEYTIDQIMTENMKELNKCFCFQESKIDFVDSLLLNAMTVSYCEALLLGECSQQMDRVVELMGPKLRTLYGEYETYYNDLGRKK